MDAAAEHPPRLCTGCHGFDVRSLLIASKAEPPPMKGGSLTAQKLQSKQIHGAIPKYYSHHKNLTELHFSSDRCDLCSAIWQQYVQTASPQDLTPEGLCEGLGSQPIFFGTTQWSEPLHGSPTVFLNQLGPRGESRTLAWFEVFADRDDIPSDTANYLIGRSSTHNSGSAACLKIALEMLETCLTTHAKCNQPDEFPGRMPTRLVQIDAESSVARLIDTNGSPQRFVALSYCWGGEDSFTLNRASEQSLRNGVSLECFPRTLRDALLVTRNLNLRYIWIDAICIYQDSTDDWKRESSRMPDVYRGAVVTIDAAAASKASDGIFCERPAKSARCKLEWRNGELQRPSIYLRPATEFSDTTLHTSPTSKRAWTLQENLLSPRTLHYGSQQIAFDCAEGWHDEAGRHTQPTELYNSKSTLHDLYHEGSFRRWLVKHGRKAGMPTVVTIKYYSFRYCWSNLQDFEEDFLSRRYFHIVFQGFSPTPAEETMTYYDQWREIVHQYTSRLMSKETDVFPALAGLAKAFFDFNGEDAYTAGMWKGDLVRSMNWQRQALFKNAGDGWRHEPRRPCQYLAPSWSWASILGRGTLFVGSRGNQIKRPMISRVKIIDVNTETEGDLPFMRVLRGYLILEGYLLQVDSPLLEKSQDHQLPATWDYLETLTKMHSEFRAEFVQQHREEQGQQFAILYLSSHRELEDDYTRLENYLLLETAGKEDYRRVGRFNTARTGDRRKRYLRKRGLQLPIENEIDMRMELTKAAWKKTRICIV